MLSSEEKKEAVEYLQKSIVSAWTGHGPFACKLVEKLQPQITVELGVDYGFSFLCFLLGGYGTVYGIDSFEGDPSAGVRDTFSQFITNLCELKGKYPSLNSDMKIIKGYFNDKAKEWCTSVSKPIDILHIDGAHDYDSIKGDYTNWMPLTNYSGLILFHDTLSFPNTVGKVYNEIYYPKFNFLHTHGLAVVCRDKNKLLEVYEMVKDGSFGPVSKVENV